MLQPTEDVSPARWNIANTTWFFEEIILKAFDPEYKVFDESYGYLFNSYYNSVGERTARNKRGELSRPTVREIFEYRKYVDQKMCALIATDPPSEAIELIHLGLNHEQQHQELFLTDLKYSFAANPLLPVYRPDFAICEAMDAKTGEFVNVDHGIYEIGPRGDGFYFDNELGRHKVHLDRFQISKDLVTNGQLLEFIEAGGYRDFQLWHSDGWDWVNENNIESPLYWQRRGGEWFQFTLSGPRKIPLDSPVCHVSFYEAAAYAEWNKMRLPTEFE